MERKNEKNLCDDPSKGMLRKFADKNMYESLRSSRYRGRYSVLTSVDYCLWRQIDILQVMEKRKKLVENMMLKS